MVDWTICINGSCPLNGSCNRFEGNVPWDIDFLWQSTSLFVPNEIGGCWRCDYYITKEVEDETKM